MSFFILLRNLEQVSHFDLISIDYSTFLFTDLCIKSAQILKMTFSLRVWRLLLIWRVENMEIKTFLSLVVTLFITRIEDDVLLELKLINFNRMFREQKFICSSCLAVGVRGREYWCTSQSADPPTSSSTLPLARSWSREATRWPWWQVSPSHPKTGWQTSWSPQQCSPHSEMISQSFSSQRARLPFGRASREQTTSTEQCSRSEEEHRPSHNFSAGSLRCPQSPGHEADFVLFGQKTLRLRLGKVEKWFSL